jgi:hypothetical protein
VPNHYRLGFTANGMSVWDVDDALVDQLGERIGQLPGVSHCYRRPRHAEGICPTGHTDRGHTTCSPCCTAVRAPTWSSRPSQVRSAAGHRLPGPRHPVFHRDPEEDRPASSAKPRKLTMFRISQYMRELAQAEATGAYPAPHAPEATARRRARW